MSNHCTPTSAWARSLRPGRFLLALCAVSCMLYTGLLAQNYRCDWSVVDQGGGLMTSTSFRTTPSVGQTAIGLITSSSYQAFIGFWQIDTAVTGIQEEKPWQQGAPLVTFLCAPAPNPCVGAATIRYSLAAEAHVSLQLFDLAGRNVSTLVNAQQKSGRYSLTLTAHGPLVTRHLSRGVYFLKMKAGDYQATRKLVVE